MGDLHPNAVRPPRSRDAADPAHRRGKGAFVGLSAASVGLELGLSVAIGLLGGYFLDQHFGTAPWLMLLGLAFGLAAGFRGVLRAVRQADREAARQQEAERHG